MAITSQNRKEMDLAWGVWGSTGQKDEADAGAARRNASNTLAQAAPALFLRVPSSWRFQTGCSWQSNMNAALWKEART